MDYLRKLLKSKTFDFNALVGIIFAFITASGVEISPEIMTAILAVGNIILRMLTTEAIEAK